MSHVCLSGDMNPWKRLSCKIDSSLRKNTIWFCLFARCFSKCVVNLDTLAPIRSSAADSNRSTMKKLAFARTWDSARPSDVEVLRAVGNLKIEIHTLIYNRLSCNRRVDAYMMHAFRLDWRIDTRLLRNHCSAPSRPTDSDTARSCTAFVDGHQNYGHDPTRKRRNWNRLHPGSNCTENSWLTFSISVDSYVGG